MTLLTMSFYGAVLISAILIIRAFTLHRLPKKTFLVLWGIALLRLLVPFELSSGISLYSLLPADFPFSATDTTGTTDSANANFADIADSVDANFAGIADSVDSNFADTAAPAENSNVTMPYQPEAEPAIEHSPTNTSKETASGHMPHFFEPDTSSGSSVTFVIWAAGGFLCAAFFLISYLRLCREFKTSLPVTNEYAKSWLAGHPLKRRLSIRQSDRISTPLTYGIFRPVILLPKKTDWENRSQLDYILYHEFIHIRRFDLAAKLLLIAALCLHWFNPLVWVMYLFFNRDLELSCDECVLRQFNGTKADYANTLIDMADRQSHPAVLYSPFSENAIEERITSIMKLQKATLGTICFSLLLIAAVIVMLAASPKKTADDSPEPPEVTSFPDNTEFPKNTPIEQAASQPTPTSIPTATPTATPPVSFPYPSILETARPASDGTYAGIITGCTTDTLQINLVEYITDDDTERKAEIIELLGLQAGMELEDDGNFTNGYYIYDIDPRSGELSLADDVVIRLLDPDSPDGYREVSELYLFLNEVITEYGWSTQPYFFRIEQGMITGIYEKMIP